MSAAARLFVALGIFVAGLAILLQVTRPDRYKQALDEVESVRGELESVRTRHATELERVENQGSVNQQKITENRDLIDDHGPRIEKLEEQAKALETESKAIAEKVRMLEDEVRNARGEHGSQRGAIRNLESEVLNLRKENGKILERLEQIEKLLRRDEAPNLE